MVARRGCSRHEWRRGHRRRAHDWASQRRSNKGAAGSWWRCHGGADSRDELVGWRALICPACCRHLSTGSGHPSLLAAAGLNRQQAAAHSRPLVQRRPRGCKIQQLRHERQCASCCIAHRLAGVCLGLLERRSSGIPAGGLRAHSRCQRLDRSGRRAGLMCQPRPMFSWASSERGCL